MLYARLKLRLEVELDAELCCEIIACREMMLHKPLHPEKNKQTKQT